MIDVSPDGVSPLHPEIIRLLSPHLTYQHKQLLRGLDAFDNVTGERQNMAFENRHLFGIEQGRLTTGYGFIPKIARVLTEYGHQVHYYDLSPPRQREGCYVADWDALLRTFSEFRPRQFECLQIIDQAQGGIINAPTGFGKTVLIAMLAILYPHAKIHIVVKPTDVARRIVRQLSRYLPLVGQVGGGKRKLGRVTVFTADSLHLSDGDCDFLFADEGHLLMAESYARELGRAYRISRNFTFTATPEGRLDGADARLEMFFGPQIFYMSYPEGVALGLVAPIRVRWLTIQCRFNPAANKTGTARDRWGIWRNQERNQQIADDARTNYPAEKQVLILTATVDHAIHLWNCLPEYELCYGETEENHLDEYKRSNILPQSFLPMTAHRREALRAGFEAQQVKKVIATDVWSTGVDFAPLQVLYRADARESVQLDTQGPGRTSRVFGGKEYGEVVDCYDAWDKAFKRKSGIRHKHYAQHEWEQDWPVGRGRRQISHA